MQPVTVCVTKGLVAETKIVIRPTKNADGSFILTKPASVIGFTETNTYLIHTELTFELLLDHLTLQELPICTKGNLRHKIFEALEVRFNGSFTRKNSRDLQSIRDSQTYNQVKTQFSQTVLKDSNPIEWKYVGDQKQQEIEADPDFGRGKLEHVTKIIKDKGNNAKGNVKIGNNGDGSYEKMLQYRVHCSVHQERHWQLQTRRH